MHSFPRFTFVRIQEGIALHSEVLYTKESKMSRVLVFAAALGLMIAYVDWRKWDATGMVALVLFAVSALFGIVAPQRPWLWALAIGLWLAFVGIARASNTLPFWRWSSGTDFAGFPARDVTEGRHELGNN
jgi:hypothetical protein